MPKVSLIVPCYNEEKTIGLLLGAICQQSYPVSELEVVIADGKSTDRTLGVIADFQAAHPALAIRVVENPVRAIPAALNQAIRASQGEFLIRLDAHSMPEPDYVARSVAALESALGENVGGVWQIQPGGPGWVARSISVAAAHPLGVGDALYRFTTHAGLVDTVPFGAFRRTLIDRVGFFDESLLTNEDYEFNARIRQSGGKIWLDPAIRSTYFARSTLEALARQYFRYGFWKYRMLRRYPGTLRWRQALPPVFVLSLLVLVILSIFLPLPRYGLALEVGSYLLIMFAAGLRLAVQRKDGMLAAGVPLAIAAMHFSWGVGFLVSVVQSNKTV
jgi:succinoglycan biosynthesis protein ExoA